MVWQFRPVIVAALAQHGAVKLNPAAKVVMVKTLEGVVIEEVEDFYISPPTVQILNEGELDSALKTMIGSLKERTTEAELRGTGWKMRRVSTLEINCARYKPLKGSSFLELPPKLAAKKALVNVKNSDQQCFKWAVLSALFPAPKDAQRLSKYAEHEGKLDWGGLPTAGPVTLDKIALFERRNNISIHVYGWDDRDKPFLLRKSAEHEAPQRLGFGVCGCLRIVLGRRAARIPLHVADRQHGVCWPTARCLLADSTDAAGRQHLVCCRGRSRCGSTGGQCKKATSQPCRRD